MSYFFDGTSSSSASLITFGEGAAVRYPFAISAWVYPLRTTVDETIIALRAPNGDVWRLTLAGASAAKVAALSFNGSTSGFANAATAASYVANRWQFVMARFDGNTNRVAFLDTQTPGSNTTDSLQTGGTTISQMYIGRDLGGRNFQGYIADVSVRWSRTTGTPAVINAEVLTRLGVKSNPLKVRPSNVVLYWPMTSPGPQKNKAPSGLNLVLPQSAYTNYAPGIDPRVQQLTNPQKIFTNQLVNIPVLYRQRQMQGMAA